MLFTLSVLGVVQCALGALAMLFVIERWHLSHKLMLVVISLIGLSFLRGVLIQHGVLRIGAPLVLLTMMLSLSIMPVMHLFLRSLLNPKFELNLLNALHFVPAILVVLWCVSQVSNVTQHSAANVLELSFYELLEVTRGVANLMLIFAGGQLLAYVYLNGRIIKQSESHAGAYLVSWARRIHRVNVMVALVLVILIVASLLKVDVPLRATVALSMISKLTFLILGFIWFLMLLKDTLNKHHNSQQDNSKVEPLFKEEDADNRLDNESSCGLIPKKYQKSGISQVRMEILHERAMTALKQEQLFLNNELTLALLAEKIACSAHHLSQAINSIEQKGFNDILNSLRVAEAKQQLMDQPDKTVTDIAMDSGFNSKSSFYALFKKATGQTPGAFKKQHPVL
jgi:AraC-like DNA-binding protein